MRMGRDTFYGFPFDWVVGIATKSIFSHASVALVEDGEIYLVEVDINGTSKIRFLDWIDSCATTDLEVWTPRLSCIGMGPHFRKRIEKSIRTFLAQDDDYDLQFKTEVGHAYCTQSVISIYADAGIPGLCEAKTVKQVLPAWSYYSLFLPGNAISKCLTGASMPLEQGLYFVGNEKWGLMSSEWLRKLFQYP